MRQTISILVLGLAISGCSAAKSAVGALTGPKPQPVTVTINHAPEPTVVVNERPAKKKKKSFFEKVGIVTTSTVVGAGLGALASEALDTETTASALVGAGVGAAAGVVIADD